MQAARHYSSNGSGITSEQNRTRAAPIHNKHTNPIWYRLATSGLPQTVVKPNIQAKSYPNGGTAQVPRTVQKTITAPGPGEPISESIRSRVEPVVGMGLAQVRVHNDVTARNAANALNAKAFTYQNNIFLGTGQSKADTRLLAHELTHVAQQGALGSASNSKVQCAFACPSNLEDEINTLRERIQALPPESSPEREDLQAQLTWREQLAAQCGQLAGFTSTRADSLAYLKAEAMMHRGRIADASRELVRMEPTSSAYRISLDNLISKMLQLTEAKRLIEAQ